MKSLCGRGTREQCEEMRASRLNQRYLPDIALPMRLQLTSDYVSALSGCDAAILAVTVAALRETLRRLAQTGRLFPVVWLCKGLEAAPQNCRTRSPPKSYRRNSACGVLSGPSFAQEVARGIPAAVTLAAGEADFAALMARELHSPRLRIYSSEDVTGVEVGGAVKNVIAIAAGISDGLGFGESARAALVTRGLAEVTRLGLRLGGRFETFMGLSGVGDLILTCTGTLSRNRQVGLRLAAGRLLPEILQDLGHVAEGVHSAREVLKLAIPLEQKCLSSKRCAACYTINWLLRRPWISF